jgi:hypothetical protein
VQHKYFSILHLPAQIKLFTPIIFYRKEGAHLPSKMPFFDNYKFRFCRIGIFVLFSGLFPDTGSNTEQEAATGSNQKTQKLFYSAFTNKPQRGHGGRPKKARQSRVNKKCGIAWRTANSPLKINAANL